jgi:prophage antirepressor-like protein
VVTLNGNPWFVGTDVRSALDIAQHGGWLAFLGEEEQRIVNKRGSTSVDGLFSGRVGRVQLISESGLYKLIMRSDKPQAKPFQDWVTKVVLPAIRKDGVENMLRGGVGEDVARCCQRDSSRTPRAR